MSWGWFAGGAKVCGVGAPFTRRSGEQPQSSTVDNGAAQTAGEHELCMSWECAEHELLCAQLKLAEEARERSFAERDAAYAAEAKARGSMAGESLTESLTESLLKVSWLQH